MKVLAHVILHQLLFAVWLLCYIAKYLRIHCQVS